MALTGHGGGPLLGAQCPLTRRPLLRSPRPTPSSRRTPTHLTGVRATQRRGAAHDDASPTSQASQNILASGLSSRLLLRCAGRLPVDSAD